MVNESMAYARLGETKKADDSLQKALKVAPDNAAANFNMGLLKAEQNDLKGAEKYLRAALKADPQMAQAAYNLCVITAKDRLDEAVTWCRKAAELRPQEPKYAYTLAFYRSNRATARVRPRCWKVSSAGSPPTARPTSCWGISTKIKGRKRGRSHLSRGPGERRATPRCPPPDRCETQGFVIRWSEQTPIESLLLSNGKSNSERNSVSSGK